MNRFSLDKELGFMIGDSGGGYVYYEEAMEEIERLKHENIEIKQSYNERLDDLEGVLHNMGKFNDRLKQENEQLREALRKCIPFTACSNKANNVCEFCYEKEHKDDCEYIRLTKEAND